MIKEDDATKNSGEKTSIYGRQSDSSGSVMPSNSSVMPIDSSGSVMPSGGAAQEVQPVTATKFLE